MKSESQGALVRFGQIVFALGFTFAAIIAVMVWSSRTARADFPERMYCYETGEYYNPKYHKCERIRQAERREYRESQYERARRLEREKRAEIERRERREWERRAERRETKVYGWIDGGTLKRDVAPLDAARCPYPAVKVVGDNANSQPQAELVAEAKWQDTVLWMYGSRAMTVANAIRKRMSCGQAAPDPTGFFRKNTKRIVEGITGVTGVERSTVPMKCQFEAIPCQAPIGEVVDPVIEQ